MDNHSEEKKFDIHQFEWFLPVPPQPTMLITITENGVCLNRKLCEVVPKQIQIGAHKDGESLLLADYNGNGYNVPKNGMIKAPLLVQFIEEKGVHLPARYLVEQVDELWFATLIPPTPASTMPTRTPKKPRKRGLKTMLPKKQAYNVKNY